MDYDTVLFIVIEIQLFFFYDWSEFIQVYIWSSSQIMAALFKQQAAFSKYIR